MINEKIQDALNEQVNAEFFSAYLYLSMSAYYKSLNLNGFAHWLQVQAQEELIHGMLIYNYINERGGRVKLMPVEGPDTNWPSTKVPFEEAYKHEQKITAMINNLVNLAIEMKDHATNNFLQWFVAEQVEEEASADAVVQKLKLVGEAGDGLFMLDKELSLRIFNPPAIYTGA